MLKINLILLLLFCSFISGCASKHPDNSVYSGEKINKIAILPPQRIGEDKVGTITCTLSERDFDAEPTTKENGRLINDMLIKALKDDKRYFEVSDSKCYAYFNAIIQNNVKSSHIKIIQEIGKELNADAILYTRLFRFIEKEGGSYGATKPSSVALSIHLIRVSDGSLLWHKTFDETQKALTDNILDISLYKQAGLKWLSASELAAYGIANAVDDLNRFLPK
jgi:ABC-type uncharacterized transport system auxiliary subunit